MARRVLLRGGMMTQLVARARPSTVLFRDHGEARLLWDLVLEVFPEAAALVLMPNHLHLDLPHADPDDRLSDVMRSYARARNHRRGENGVVWEPHPEPRVPSGTLHGQRLRRYTHLNPCRAGLTRDPLTWPWTLHREQVGLGVPGRVAPNPARLHAYVSGDPSADVRGTPLPKTPFRPVTWEEVVHAVCGVMRTGANAVREQGAVRMLALRTAWVHELRDVRLLGEHTGASRGTIYRVVEGVPERGARIRDALLGACVQVVGDSRFRALADGDLRPRWRTTKYAGLR